MVYILQGQTDWRNSTAVPRRIPPFVPFDASQLTLYDVYLAPLLDNIAIIAATVAFYVLLTYISHYILLFFFGDSYSRCSPRGQIEQRSRVCSMVNGVFAIRTAYLYFLSLQQHGWQFHNYMYQTIEGYWIHRYMIVGYFLWDVGFCIYYNFGVAWTVHAIASSVGTYGLAFPFAEQYAGHFVGAFELSNIPMHLSQMLLELSPEGGLSRGVIVPILQGIFFLLYVTIRVIGGTLVAASWWSDSKDLLSRGIAHSPLYIYTMLAAISAIMLLQYVWLWEIIKVAIGKSSTEASSLSGSDTRELPTKRTSPGENNKMTMRPGKRHARKED